MNPFSAELKLAAALRPARTKSKAELLDDGFRLTPYATLVKGDRKISLELCNRPLRLDGAVWVFVDRDLQSVPIPADHEWLVYLSELN